MYMVQQHFSPPSSLISFSSLSPIPLSNKRILIQDKFPGAWMGEKACKIVSFLLMRKMPNVFMFPCSPDCRNRVYIEVMYKVILILLASISKEQMDMYKPLFKYSWHSTALFKFPPLSLVEFLLYGSFWNLDG